MKAKNFNDSRTAALRESGVSEHAGFPNPATDRSLQNLDINILLIRHSASTYLMRIAGNEWRVLGIFNKDIVIVDRALGARANDLVVWWQGENFVISHQNQVPQETETWGVVSATIHQFREKL
ncbi:hypothetical protein H0X10_00720 [Candidatus Saccharibacteria bacterium]|nr:hypothetical protein [Candidatus Saccharibacteria bacterium]